MHTSLVAISAPIPAPLNQIQNESYPGGPGVYKRIEGIKGQWVPYAPHHHLAHCRQIVFKATPGALICKFKVLGFLGGQVRLVLKFPRHRALDIVYYLMREQIIPKETNLCEFPGIQYLGKYFTRMAENVNENKDLFKLMCKHNTFNDDDVRIINNILKNEYINVR